MDRDKLIEDITDALMQEPVGKYKTMREMIKAVLDEQLPEPKNYLYKAEVK